MLVDENQRLWMGFCLHGRKSTWELLEDLLFTHWWRWAVGYGVKRSYSICNTVVSVCIHICQGSSSVKNCLERGRRGCYSTHKDRAYRHPVETPVAKRSTQTLVNNYNSGVYLKLQHCDHHSISSPCWYMPFMVWSLFNANSEHHLRFPTLNYQHSTLLWILITIVTNYIDCIYTMIVLRMDK